MTSSRPAFELRPATEGRPALEIHRSPRRRRTASANAVGEVLRIRVPAGMPHADEDRMISGLVGKVLRARQAQDRGGDAELQRRATALADRYLDGVRPASVRWSPRMNVRLGSCSVADGNIRISDRLASAPDWTLDYVIVHELAHLLEPNHSLRFHALVARYPDVARAQAWLDGFTAGQLAAGARQSSSPSPASSPESSSGS